MKKGKNETPEMLEEVNKRCRARHAELKTKFYESLSKAPISIPPDFSDNEIWHDKWGLAPGTDGINNTESWKEGGWADIDTLLTKREQAYFDDKQIYAHLRARGWEIPRALDMIRETLRWRREAKPWTVMATEIENHLKSGKNYTCGWTKLHQPTVIMRCRYDVPGDNPGKIKTILFAMERLLRLTRARNLLHKDVTDPVDLRDTPPHEQVSWIFDCKGFAKKDIDIPLTKELAKVLDHYPETLGVVFAIDTPIIFRAFWKMVRGFLDERTVKKINFVSGEQGRKKVFPNYYVPEELEVCFSGANRYRYNHEPYFAMLVREQKEGITILEQPPGAEDGDDGRRGSIPGSPATGKEDEIDYAIEEFEAELEDDGEGEVSGDSSSSGKVPTKEGKGKKKQ